MKEIVNKDIKICEIHVMSIKMKCSHYLVKYFLVFWNMETERTFLPFLFRSGGFLSKPGKPVRVPGRHMEMFTSLARFLSLFSASEMLKTATKFQGTITSSQTPKHFSILWLWRNASNFLIFIHWSLILANSTKTGNKSEIRCVSLPLEFCYCRRGHLQQKGWQFSFHIVVLCKMKKKTEAYKF